MHDDALMSHGVIYDDNECLKMTSITDVTVIDVNFRHSLSSDVKSLVPAKQI